MIRCYRWIPLLACFFVTLSSCKRVEEPVEPAVEVPEALVPGSPVGYAYEGGGGATSKTSQISAPVLASVLPNFEELLHKKIICSASIHEGLTLTIDSPEWMTREEMIDFYVKCFREQGFEIRPVDDTTVHFARIAGERAEAKEEPPLRRRRTVLAPRAVAKSGANGFRVQSIQAPIIEALLPNYAHLVDKEIVADESIDSGATMTINSGKQMKRAEAIKFYEDSFKVNGYRLELVGDKEVRVSREP